MAPVLERAAPGKVRAIGLLTGLRAMLEVAIDYLEHGSSGEAASP